MARKRDAQGSTLNVASARGGHMPALGAHHEPIRLLLLPPPRKHPQHRQPELAVNFEPVSLAVSHPRKGLEVKARFEERLGEKQPRIVWVILRPDRSCEETTGEVRCGLG
jgi:hypothetical protein